MTKEPKRERPKCPICSNEIKDKDIVVGYSFWDERVGKLGDPNLGHLACAVASSVGEPQAKRKIRNYRGLLAGRWIAMAARKRFSIGPLKRIDKRLVQLRGARHDLSGHA